MTKIAIIAGHGINTPGRRTMFAPIKKEWELNDNIVVRTIKGLKEHGVDVKRFDDPTGKVDISIQTRAKNVNAWKPDFLLEVHHNAGINGGTGGGIVSIVGTKASAKSVKYQKELYNELIRFGGLKGNRSNPFPKQQLYIMNAVYCPSVLVEYGFMDSRTDVPYITSDSYAQKMANANVSFIAKTFNLKPTQKPIQKPVQKPSSKKYTSLVDYLKSQNIDSSFSNRAKLAKKYGISNYTGSANQNNKLLNIMQSGTYAQPSKSTYKRVSVKQGANVRTGAGTGYGKAMGALKYGTQVQVIGKSGNWDKIKYNGKVGYIRRDLLK